MFRNGRKRKSYGKDVSSESIEVDQCVNSIIRESLHASIVIRGGIDMVDSDSVGSKLLHHFSISLALVSVDEGILGTKLISNT